MELFSAVFCFFFNIIYVPSWTWVFSFLSDLSLMNPLLVSNLIHQLCVLTDHLRLIYMQQLWTWTFGRQGKPAVGLLVALSMEAFGLQSANNEYNPPK